MSTPKKLVVIDGKSVFYRGYYAMPHLSKPDGTPTGGVYGFMVMALEAMKKFEPDYACVAWDKSKTNIRSRVAIYPQYKANRKPAPEDFKVQIPILKELLEALGWPLYELDDYEADDIMGAFAKQAEAKNHETILITGDHDVLQLVSPKTKVAIMKKGITNIDLYTLESFKAKYDMDVEQFIDYKALRGDPSDNIPGVAGVGEKTATQLIKDYGSLDKVYENIPLIKPSIAKKLEADKDMAYTSEKLVTIMTDAPVKLNLKDMSVDKAKPKKLNQLLSELEFNTIRKQLPPHLRYSVKSSEVVDLSSGDKAVIVKTKAELESISFKGDKLLIYPRYQKKHGYNMLSLIISDSPRQSFIVNVNDITNEQAVVETLAKLTKNKSIIGFELKQVLQTFLHYNMQLPSVGHDLKIASFVLDPLQRDMSLPAVAQHSLGMELKESTNEEFVGNSSGTNLVLWSLYQRQKELLKNQPQLKDLLQGVEFPFIEVIAKMEFYGIKLDKPYFKDLSQELEDDISDLEQTIYGLAGKEFNVGSPSQLAKILYGDLNLPTTGVKKGKTGYSTAARELGRLRHSHEIIGYIMQYREVTKIKNTYVDPLPSMVGEDGRLHSSFSQTTASTGRLSSSDPNMQNIPIRTEVGQKVRKGLVAEDGCLFVQADYSQFELRLAAALSGDKHLIDIFNSGVDIHTQTAVRVLGLDEDKITKDQRSHAKAINFGILYGQGPHGLSESTGMTIKEAGEFIDKYYQAYPALRDYLDGLEEQAKEEGFVTTLLGRKRPTPDAKSSNFQVQNAAIRAAVNLPIQGSAADLVKLAMIQTGKQLPNNCKQVLQIHDSIIVECPEEEAQQISQMMIKVMEKIYALPVKLKVDVAIGKNWGEL